MSFLIDSQRLAAFLLGFHGGLQRFLGTGIKGDIRKVQDVHGCLKKFDEAALRAGGQAHSGGIRKLTTLLHEAGELHDVVCGIGPSEETVSERRAMEKLERVALDTHFHRHP